MALNPITDIMKHKDEEIIEYITSIMNGIVKNYNVSMTQKSPEILWGNFGDIVMVDQILRSMNNRNKEQLAASQEQA